MSRWRVVSRISGVELGVFDGETPEDAIDTLNKAAGYRDSAHAAEVLGRSVEQLRSELLVTKVQP